MARYARLLRLVRVLMSKWLTDNIVWIIVAVTVFGLALWIWCRFRAGARFISTMSPEQAEAARKRIIGHSDAERKRIEDEADAARRVIDEFLD